MEIQKMDAEKWQVYVTSEFEKLLSCKLGTLATEKTKRIGPTPTYNREQQADIIREQEANIRFKIVAEFRSIIEDLDMADAHDDYLSNLIENGYESVDDMFRNATAGLFIHPEHAAWVELAEKLSEEFNLRESVMEREAADTIRNFCTGVLFPQALNRELREFEAKEF